MAGRAKSTLLKVMLGTAKPDRRNYREPLPATNIAAAPAWLTDEQREDWAFKCAHAPPGLLKQMDRGTLQWSVIVDDIIRCASIAYAKQRNRGSKRAQCYLATIAKFTPLSVKLNTELGFSPAARPRIQVTPEPDAKRSEFERLMG